MKARNVTPKVVLVTGATSGIGREAALQLYRRGCTVYGAARRTERMASLRQEGIHCLSLDVTDESSMCQCVQTILEREGRLDVLVNNAGFGLYGAVENVALDDARRQLDVNLFGLARMVQLVVPQMRRQGSGRIVNVSSMAGKVHTAYGAWYHASKFAVEGFSDCLRVELQPFGIHVSLVEPGLIRTEWSGITADHLRASSEGGAYEASARRVAAVMEKLYAGRLNSSVSVPARAIVRASLSRHPRQRYLVGFMARPSVFLRRVLPTRLYDACVRRIERV